MDKFNYWARQLKSSFLHTKTINLLLVCLLVLPLSCSYPQVYPQRSLSQQILSPRPNHDGKLTNQSCLKYSGDKCDIWTVREYDLNKASDRAELNDLNFICKIGSKRYKICKDKPGFCHISYTQSCFLFICKDPQENVDYMSIEPYKAVLDANVKCFNQSVYNFEDF